MTLFKATILVLLLVFGFSCSRSAGDNSQSIESVEQTERPFKNVDDSLANFEIETNLKEDGQALNEESNRARDNEFLDPQLSFLFFSFSWDTWVLVFSILTMVLLLLLISLFRGNSTLNDSVDEKNAKLNKKNDEIRQLQSDVQILKSEVNKWKEKEYSQVQKRKINTEKEIPKPNQNLKDFYDDEKTHEKVWSINNTTSKPAQQEVKQPVHLFAEKATEDSTFSSVSDQKNDHRTIFKLSLENEQAETAHFEVIDSDFIFKMAANSPDTYLYTVCKPENSNQNFAGEIITVKKGIAHKVDGKWQVKDENKAKIKFQ